MDYGYEKVQNGDKNISETTDTDKRNTYSAGIDFRGNLIKRTSFL